MRMTRLPEVCVALMLCWGMTSVLGDAFGQDPQIGQDPERGVWKGWVNALPANAHPRLKHRVFRSSAMNVNVGYVVYVPRGYEQSENARRRYPVVYFLGGNHSTELSGTVFAKQIDEGIRSSVIPPRFYVFVNGGSFSHYDYNGSLGETAFIRELIPHVDATYRTIPTRAGRALEGFSMGSRAVARNIFKYPNLFCSAAAVSGVADGERRAAENDGEVRAGGPNIGAMNNAWDLARLYAKDAAAPSVNLMITSPADDARTHAATEAWVAHLRSLGIKYEYRVVPGVPHALRPMYEALGDAVMKFHERCFSGAVGPTR